MKCLFLYGYLDGEIKDVVTTHGIPPTHIKVDEHIENLSIVGRIPVNSGDLLPTHIYARIELQDSDGATMFIYQDREHIHKPVIQRMMELATNIGIRT